MTTPNFSTSILLTPVELRSDVSTSEQLIDLANDAFRRSHSPEPDKWDLERNRFPTPQDYYDMLGEDSIVALIFDLSVPSRRLEIEEENPLNLTPVKVGAERGRLVGCAAAVPWKGGWAKEGAGTEHGFEIKATCVDGHEKYLGKGLNVKMMDALTAELIQRNKSQEEPGVSRSAMAASTAVSQTATLTLWILAADFNGVYWKKRGYEEVRRKREGHGTWGCKTEFDMIVLRKDVPFDLSP